MNGTPQTVGPDHHTKLASPEDWSLPPPPPPPPEEGFGVDPGPPEVVPPPPPPVPAAEEEVLEELLEAEESKGVPLLLLLPFPPPALEGPVHGNKFVNFWATWRINLHPHHLLLQFRRRRHYFVGNLGRLD